VDFNTGVSVANGTNTDGLAKGASEKLTNGGFTAVEVIPGIYENAEPAKSTVYFSSPEARTAAEEIGKRLGRKETTVRLEVEAGLGGGGSLGQGVGGGHGFMMRAAGVSVQ